MEKESDYRFYKDKYLILLAVISIAVIVYWIAYANYNYFSFTSEYYDIGVATYSTYIHIYYPQITGGLQYLSFYNHISPFALLTLPVFALLPGPITLIAMQEISLAMAAIVLYFCAKDLLKNRLLSLSFGLAFILSIGVRGIMAWEFHPEGFIPLLLLLAFYFYIKDKMLGFSISYVLLLTVMETSWPVGMALILALLYYEFVYNKATDQIDKQKKKARIKTMCVLIIVTLAFIAFYYYVTQTLLSMYAHGLYPNLPPQLRVLNYTQLQVQNLPIFFTDNLDAAAILLVVIGTALLFLGFGISSLADPVVAVLLISPWLFEVFVLRNFTFAAFDLDYYSFAVGGSAIAAILGAKIILDNGSFMYRKISILSKKGGRVQVIAILSCITALFIVFFYSLIVGPSFPISSAPIYKNYTQIRAALSTIPSNANVMVQANIYPHLYYIEHLEFPPDTTYTESIPYGTYTLNVSFYWFKPNYVVIYPTKNVWFGSFNNSFDTNTFNIYTYMGSNFTLYNSTDGVYIYKRN